MRQLLWVICLILCIAYLIYYTGYVITCLSKQKKKSRAALSKGNKADSRSKSLTDMRENGGYTVVAGSNTAGELQNEKTETRTVILQSDLSSEKTAAIYPEPWMVETGVSSVIGTRACQQDAVRVAVFGGGENGSAQCAVGVLCDGMGGMEGGEYASNAAASRMIEMAQSVTANYPDFFAQAVLRLNREVGALCDASGRKLEAGTTLTCVVVEEDRLYWCSVGDSRIYLCRNGQIRQLSTDHNYGTMVDELIRAGKMSLDEVNPNEKREALTSYLGAAEVEEIGRNIRPIQLKAGDTVIQCSDGLYRCLSGEDLAQILRQVPDLNAAAEAMTSAAVSIPGPHDNTSVVLIRYKGTV